MSGIYDKAPTTALTYNLQFRKKTERQHKAVIAYCIAVFVRIFFFCFISLIADLTTVSYLCLLYVPFRGSSKPISNLVGSLAGDAALTINRRTTEFKDTCRHSVISNQQPHGDDTAQHTACTQSH